MSKKSPIIFILLLLGVLFYRDAVNATSVSLPQIEIGVDTEMTESKADSLKLTEDLDRDWLKMIRKGKYDINDTTIRYPKFIKFVVDTYLWADNFFNGYDPEWISSTGKRGKVRLLSDNWSDVYDFRFAKTPLLLSTNLYCNLGFQANYSVLSLSYTFDMNSLFTGKKTKHRKFDFALYTSRIFANAYYWENEGETTIHRVGNEYGYTNFKHFKFDGLNFRAAGVMAFYIFNNQKFSYGAAYNLSRYQIKSAGSWLAGLSGTFYKADFNFLRLPQNISEALNFPFDKYSLNYNAVNLLGGYSYNWVCNKHFLFNTTTLPGLGMSFSFSDSTIGRKDLFSASLRQLLSLTYCHRQFFVTGIGVFHGHILPHDKLAFMSGIFNMQFSTGIRF